MIAERIIPEPVTASYVVTLTQEEAGLLHDIARNFGGVGPHRLVIQGLGTALANAGLVGPSPQIKAGKGYYLSLNGAATRF